MYSEAVGKSPYSSSWVYWVSVNNSGQRSEGSRSPFILPCGLGCYLTYSGSATAGATGDPVITPGSASTWASGFASLTGNADNYAYVRIRGSFHSSEPVFFAAYGNRDLYQRSDGTTQSFHTERIWGDVGSPALASGSITVLAGQRGVIPEAARGFDRATTDDTPASLKTKLGGFLKDVGRLGGPGIRGLMPAASSAESTGSITTVQSLMPLSAPLHADNPATATLTITDDEWYRAVDLGDDATTYYFDEADSRFWYETPFSEAAAFVVDDGALFTNIDNFLGVEGYLDGTESTLGYEVWSADGYVSTLHAGDSVDFVDLLGHGVDIFLLAIEDPALVGNEPLHDIRMRLTFDRSLADFSVTGLDLSWEQSTSTVPIPAAGWLFGSVLLGATGLFRRRKTTQG